MVILMGMATWMLGTTTWMFGYYEIVMTYREQWNWVSLAYGVTYLSFVLYSVTIVLRISRASRALGERS